MRRQSLPISSFIAAFAALLVASCATMSDVDRRAAAEKVVASPIRTDQDRKTDTARKPVDFLTFIGVQPGMRVLDISAGGGYTTQLLALAVGPNGTVYAQSPRPGETLTKRLADHPQANVTLVTRPFDDPLPEDTAKLDLVTLVLNYHDISYLPVDRAKMNARIFASLKPGGRYVIVDHSGRPGTGISEGKSLHRIDEAVVRDEVRKAGFVLDGEGAFLRNPADTRDDSSGQPRVPTDKFVLRFVKPG